VSHRAVIHVHHLALHGLVIVEHDGEPAAFTIIRPASLRGTPFRESTLLVGAGNATVLTDAPVASLRQLAKRGDEWEVYIGEAAAPGPGPVWFHERFADPRGAVEAIRECYFGDRVDFESQALWPDLRRPRTAPRDPVVAELDPEKAVRIARGIIEGSTPNFLGCKYLGAVLTRLGVGREEPFVTVIGVKSELDESPIHPEERELWHPQALAREDAKLAAWLPNIRPAVLEACRAVLTRFGRG
jgi:hypothetical protein